MLRPPTARLLTVSPLNSEANWLPQPTGQLAPGFIIVESPAIQMVGAAASGAAAVSTGIRHGAAVAAVAVPGPNTESGISRASTASQRALFTVPPGGQGESGMG